MVTPPQSVNPSEVVVCGTLEVGATNGEVVVVVARENASFRLVVPPAPVFTTTSPMATQKMPAKAPTTRYRG
jgi:hypothetical protein